jgi:hypothetical protein
MSPVYSSPKSESAAAATAPARLAKDFDGQALWRTAPDGTTYVVTLRSGVLERYRVNEDGTATLVDSSPPPLGHRLSVPAFILGALLFVGGGLAADATGDERFTVLVIAGWILWIAGIAGRGWAEHLESRAHKAYGGKGEWHAPTNLRNWNPRTSSQLAAVEKIAEEHDGIAFVRDDGARTIDVVALRKGRVERYWVDEHGQAELAGTDPSGTPYLIDRILKATALALFLGLFAVGLFAREHKGQLLLALIAALASVMFLGWRNDPERRVRRRLRSGADRGEWTEIRTREPENGG